MRYLLTFFLIILMLQSDAQSSGGNVGTTQSPQRSGHPVKKSHELARIIVTEELTFVDFIVKFLPVLGIIGALFGVGYQIRVRRIDDRLKNQLDRINKQISDFYGPLFSLYETGHRNYYNYLSLHGEDVTFSNPNFELWLRTVFEKTNAGMETLIINKADLILGKDLPTCFLEFCKWSALMKVYNQAQQKPGFNNLDWKSTLAENPHPEIHLQAYLFASFEVLKDEQSRLLAGDRKYINEEVLIERINQRSDQYIEASRKPDTWEKEIWKKVYSTPPKNNLLTMQQQLTKAYYINPLTVEDFPDPCVIAVEGQGYFAYGTHDEFSPTINNILVRQSWDLVNWTAPEGALVAPPVWASHTHRFWSPHVVQVADQFRLYYATNPDAVDDMVLAFATSTDSSHFVDCGVPINKQPGSTFQMIDPCLFIDPVSDKHLLYYGSAHQPIRVVEVSSDGKTFISDPVDVLQLGEGTFHKLREGAFVTYNKTWERYFLWVSGDNTWETNSYAVSVFWSESPLTEFVRIPGEYTVLKPNHIWDSPGHNCIIQDAVGNDWIIYHAVDRKNPFIPGTTKFLRQMCMDRVFYTVEGWPYILNGSPSHTEQESPIPMKRAA